MYDNIWFTYKARIRAQVRLADNDLHSQLLLVWYAVFAACLSIIAIRHPKVLGDDTDIIAAMFGVMVLAMSLFVTNRDFRGRSMEMRRNYLAMQDLYTKATTPQSVHLTPDVMKAYQELLSTIENHTEMDDKYFRVFHRGALKTRVPTRVEIIEVHAYLAVRILVLAIAYLSPLTALVFV